MAKETEESKHIDNAELPAAFWDSMVDDKENPDLMAIQAIQEESTPEERAETLKVFHLATSRTTNSGGMIRTVMAT